MSDDPFTPAELEAACKAVHELEDDTTERYLSVRFEVAAALRAVLPLHAARVRAQVAAELRGLAEYHDPADRLALHSAAEHITARAHRTTPGAPNSAPDVPNPPTTEEPS